MKKIKKIFQNAKIFYGIFVLQFFVTMDTFAQGLKAGGATALSNVSTELNNYVKPACQILYAVAGIIAIVGAVQVYSKWQSGDPNATKLAASWFGGAIFICLVAAIITRMFGVTT